MNLDRVTITGADDSIGDPSSLISLTREFPFVEWGILVSSNHSWQGAARFPSTPWIACLQKLKFDVCPMNLSLHICGKWVRDLLVGDTTFPQHLVSGFSRIQLNFHAENTQCNGQLFHAALCKFDERQFIFQIDGAGGNRHLESIYGENDIHSVNAVPLFDISGGAGMIPARWPKPMYMHDDSRHCYHGYAGGLGPDSLEQQLPLIAEAAGDTRIWIDMETKVRSPDDAKFDLDKVRRCLELCQPYIVNRV